MTTHIRTFHIGVPPGGQNNSITPRSREAQQSEVVEQDTEDGARMSAVAGSAPGAAKFARANLGTSCKAEKTAGAGEEIATMDVPASNAPPAEPRNSPTAKTKSKLEAAIERLTALGDQSDKMANEKWGERSALILRDSLDFLAEYEAATEAERKAVRKSLKTKSGVSREPNVDNLPVTAVYMAVGCADKKRTRAQRKEWCRFATVVKVAAAASVRPDDAAQWLEKKTLNGILAEWRGMQKDAGKGDRKSPVPKALKDYAHLAAALAEGSRFQNLAKDELAKADAAIREAMSEATDAAEVLTPSATPAEMVAANA